MTRCITMEPGAGPRSPEQCCACWCRRRRLKFLEGSLGAVVLTYRRPRRTAVIGRNERAEGGIPAEGEDVGVAAGTATLCPPVLPPVLGQPFRRRRCEILCGWLSFLPRQYLNHLALRTIGRSRSPMHICTCVVDYSDVIHGGSANVNTQKTHTHRLVCIRLSWPESWLEGTYAHKQVAVVLMCVCVGGGGYGATVTVTTAASAPGGSPASCWGGTGAVPLTELTPVEGPEGGSGPLAKAYKRRTTSVSR
jgi:hypothetical protein